MRILNILHGKKYLAIAIASFVGLLLVYIGTQLWAVGGVQNLGVWFQVIPKINLALLVISSALFGVLVSLQIYNFRTKTCSIRSKAIGTSTGGAAAIMTLLVPSCPACLSLATIILPAAGAISAGQFLVKYNTLLLLLGIGLLMFALVLLGAFKRA